MIIFKNHWQIIVLFLLSFLIAWPLFLPGYFSHHDDLQVMRIFEMRKCFSDYQIPCRWVPDLGWGNGFPLFNYYSAFPYYIGAIFSYFVGYIIAAKILFFIPLVLGIYPIYLLAKEIFGEKIAFVSAVLYMFAPYRALDLYVRGAISEAFGMSIAPLILFLILKLIKTGKYRYVLGISISVGAFLSSHNIMTLFFSWVIAFWVLGSLWIYRFKNLWPIVISLLVGFLISAFFLVPAFLEKNLVNTDSLISADLNFRANFVSINQMFFDRTWGFGASVPGDADTISFQIGWPLWWMVILSIILIPGSLIVTKIFHKSYLKTEFLNKNSLFFWFFFVVVFVVSIFMMHAKSSIVWEALPLLQFAQFPWRFLSLTILAGSVLGVFWLVLGSQRFQNIVIVIIVLLTIILNFSFFKPNKFYPDLTDSQKLSGDLWEEQRQASLLDYLPQKSLQPREPAQTEPIIRNGKSEIINYKNYTNHFSFNLKVKETSQVEVPIFNFPLWRVYVNGKPVTIDDNNYLARISFVLPPGNYEIKGVLKNTLVRNVSNYLTVSGFILLIVIFIYGKNRKTL